jgi:hypothetical protein
LWFVLRRFEEVIEGIESGVAAAAAHLSVGRPELVDMQSKDGFTFGALGIHVCGWVRGPWRRACYFSIKRDKLAYFMRASKFSAQMGEPI